MKTTERRSLLMIIFAVSMILIGTATIVDDTDDADAVNTTEITCDFTTLNTDYTADSGKTLIVNSTITISGTVKISGGGIIKRGVDLKDALFLVESNSTLTLENITIDGGAIWSGNTITGIGAEEAAIRIEGGELILNHNSTITKNNNLSEGANASYFLNGAVNTVRYYSVGGGIAVYNGGTVVMNEGSTVSYNSVNGTAGSEEGYVTGNIDNVGGGIGVYNSGEIIMNGGTISNNKVNSRGFGGGIGLIGHGSDNNKNYSGQMIFIMNDGTISNNESKLMSGGIHSGVDYYNAEYHPTAEVKITKGTISSNSSQLKGGAMYITNSILTIDSKKIASITSNGEIESDVVIDNNQSKNGGGICLGEYLTGNTIKGAYIHNNKATDAGGGIYNSNNSKLEIKGTIISTNNSKGNGGGILCSRLSDITIIDSTINDNQSTEGEGGGLHSGVDSKISLENCMINGNQCKTNGGGLSIAPDYTSSKAEFVIKGTTIIQDNTSNDSVNHNIFMQGASPAIDVSSLNINSKIIISLNFGNVNYNDVKIIQEAPEAIRECISTSFPAEYKNRYELVHGNDGSYVRSIAKVNVYINVPSGTSYSGEQMKTLTGYVNLPIDLSEEKTFMIAGYHLKGWNKTNNDDGTAITIPYVIESSNINLYAKWEKCSHSINYEYNGGTISSPSVHEYGKITTLIVPTRTGYTFDGWYSSSEFSGDAITTLKDICVRNLTFYAKWEPIQYKILFNAGGGQGSMGQLTMKYGESKTIPPVSFTRTGYDFEGWSLTENGTNVDYRTGDSVSNLTTINNEEITLYSIWTIQKYKVEFIDADGKILKTGTYDYGTSINSTKPSENPSKEGLIFDRWSYDPLPETVTGALTIKAMYKASASPDNTFIFNNGKIIANSNGNSLNVPRSLIGDKEIVMNISVVSIVIPNGSVNTDSGFTVNVTNSNNSLPITISNKLENGYSAFDFNATNDYGSLRAFNSTIKVTIPHIGADANTMVFYLAPDGSIMKMTVISYEPGVSVTFETDHFSTYVATGVDLSIPDPVPPSTSEDDDAYQQWLQQYYQQLAEQQKQQQALKEQQEQRKVVSVAIAGIAVVMLSIAALMVTRRK